MPSKSRGPGKKFTNESFDRFLGLVAADRGLTPKKKRGPGHPVTTGSKATPPVFYRVSEKQRAELDKAGKRRGITGNAEAKRRAFPATPTPHGGTP